ncbi:unnamed protein product [Cylindrotheca closterium]|uniref:Uncharacterized protein n=1 Tax=Cylindrotheca closterium TaxID=2856 RepID=A0AAD2JJ43_9STRA|nr:unnamed protein product [Cylindrotheca closterium]
MLMQKWQAQLEAASTLKDDDSMVSDGSVNMQIYKSTSKMDSLKHCSQWTKDNKKPFKSNGSKHWDINLGVHLDSGSTFSQGMPNDFNKFHGVIAWMEVLGRIVCLGNCRVLWRGSKSLLKLGQSFGYCWLSF